MEGQAPGCEVVSEQGPGAGNSASTAQAKAQPRISLLCCHKFPQLQAPALGSWEHRWTRLRGHLGFPKISWLAWISVLSGSRKGLPVPFSALNGLRNLQALQSPRARAWEGLNKWELINSMAGSLPGPGATSGRVTAAGPGCSRRRGSVSTNQFCYFLH